MSSPSYLYIVCRKMFIEHPNATDNPQGYWAHGAFSVWNSTKLMWFSLLGIVHGILPCIFKFSTSSAIIRSFVKLVKSNRHKEELQRYMSADVIKELSDQTQRH